MRGGVRGTAAAEVELRRQGNVALRSGCKRKIPDASSVRGRRKLQVAATATAMPCVQMQEE